RAATWAGWPWMSIDEEEGACFEDLSGQIPEDDVLARLLTFPTVLITAHQASLTREALQDIAGTTGEDLRRLAASLAAVDPVTVPNSPSGSSVHWAWALRLRRRRESWRGAVGTTAPWSVPSRPRPTRNHAVEPGSADRDPALEPLRPARGAR